MDIPNLKRIRESFSRLSPFRAKEDIDYPSAQMWMQRLMMGGTHGGDFLKDIYGDYILTPHEEMWECEKMSRENAFIQTAVEILKDILIGNELTVEAEDDDEYTKDFYDEWIQKSGYKLALAEAIENFIKLGNGYIEILPGLKTGIPRKAIPIPRAWKIWIIPDEQGNLHYYEEVPKTYRGKEAETVKVNYEGYGRYRTIRAVEYKNPIQHFKWGISHIPHYGRSPLASAISDNKILREIERAMAVVARYKAIPRKLISINNADGMGISQKEIDNIIEYWNNLSDLENPVIGGKKIDLLDLSYAGQELNYDPMISYLKKKITSVLAPQFYVHGDTTTYAVALEQKNLFYLTVMARRQMIEQPINDLFEEIRIKHNSLPVELRGKDWQPLKKAWVKFGEFDFETKEEERAMALNLWNSGLITLDEARQKFELPPIGDEQGGNAFKWDITNLQPVQQPMSISPRAIKDDREKRKG